MSVGAEFDGLCNSGCDRMYRRPEVHKHREYLHYMQCFQLKSVPVSALASAGDALYLVYIIHSDSTCWFVHCNRRLVHIIFVLGCGSTSRLQLLLMLTWSVLH